MKVALVEVAFNISILFDMSGIEENNRKGTTPK